MARTKTNTQNNPKHVQHHDATDIWKNYILCFSDFSLKYNDKVENVDFSNYILTAFKSLTLIRLVRNKEYIIARLGK